MAAEVLEIVSRHRPSSIGLVEPADFTTSAGGPVDAAHALRPEVSLYCLDLPNRRALFVETGTDIDLAAAPFYYQAQFEHARRLIAVPYDEFHRLAAARDDPGGRLVLLYSTGRCGSTLLSRAFGQAPGVVSLSEPDVLTQIVGLRPTDGSADREVEALAAASVRLLCKPNAAHTRAETRWVIKFRSMGIEVADLLHRAFPAARSLFLYRDAEAVVESSLRAYQAPPKAPDLATPEGRELVHRYVSWLRAGPARQMLRVLGAATRAAGRRDWPVLRRLAQGLVQSLRGAEPSKEQLCAVLWVSAVSRYLELHRAGAIPVAFRYEDMVAKPRETLEAIFRHAGLPTESAGAACDAVMGRDSQEGSPLSREQAKSVVLSDGQLAEMRQTVRAVVAMHREIAIPGFVAPGTTPGAVEPPDRCVYAPAR